MNAKQEIKKAVERAAFDPEVTAVQPGQITPITEAVNKQLGPVLEHLTNTEEWWRSKVTLGSLTAMVAGATAIIAEIKAGTWNVEIISSGLAGLLGGGFSLWGRWVASRPIGK